MGVPNLKDTAPVHAAIAGGYWDCTEVLIVRIKKPVTMKLFAPQLASQGSHPKVRFQNAF